MEYLVIREVEDYVGETTKYVEGVFDSDSNAKDFVDQRFFDLSCEMRNLDNCIEIINNTTFYIIPIETESIIECVGTLSNIKIDYFSCESFLR